MRRALLVLLAMLPIAAHAQDTAPVMSSAQLAGQLATVLSETMRQRDEALAKVAVLQKQLEDAQKKAMHTDAK